MSFLFEECSIYDLVDVNDMSGFTCGDQDLDDFFTNDCFGYAKQLLGKSYCYKLDSDTSKVVCAFTLANAGIRVDDLPNARKKKIETDIPHAKTLKDYPAVLIGRLAVSQEFRSKHIGSDVLEYIKYWFMTPTTKRDAALSSWMPTTTSIRQTSIDVMVSSLYSAPMNKKSYIGTSSQKWH